MSVFQASRFSILKSAIQRCSFATGTTLNGPKVAVVLSGSGVYDGSEIHEASACFVHLTRAGADLSVYAPDITQMHVINHVTGEPSANELRNVLVESARIARGKIHPLTELKAASHDAVVFPGGFGAAKNLSNFATEGINCKVHPEVVRILKEFHSEKKPMALCCIAPVLVAKVIPKVEITLGQDKDNGTGQWPYAGSTEAVRKWGAVHHNRNVDGVMVDKKNGVVTSPAFMYDTPNFHEIFDGIGSMIKEVLKLIK